MGIFEKNMGTVLMLFWHGQCCQWSMHVDFADWSIFGRGRGGGAAPPPPFPCHQWGHWLVCDLLPL
jgi:hypothetical protein